jgi:SOS-response transcriptional repressor LexA
MNAPVSLTSRQHDALRFVAGYLEAHEGVSPTHDQIRRALGLGSKSSVVRLLDALEERGHLRRARYRQQSIEVLADVTIPRTPEGAPLFFVPAGQIGIEGTERAAA